MYSQQHPLLLRTSVTGGRDPTLKDSRVGLQPVNAGDTTQSVPRGYRSSPAGKQGDDVQASTALDKIPTELCLLGVLATKV